MQAAVRPAADVPRIWNARKDLSSWVPYYTSSITVLGIGLVVLAFINRPADRVGLLIFAGLAGLVELGNVELFKGSRSHVSVSSIVALASILVLGPWAGALTHMVSGFATGLTGLRGELRDGKRTPALQRSAFNAGMWITAAAAAGWVYTWAGGAPGSVARASNVLPLIGAAGVEWVLNASLLLGVIRLQTGRSLLGIWKRDFEWAAPISVLGGVLGGGALALAYQMFGVLGIAVFTLPVFAVSYSFRVYKHNMEVYVDKLEKLNVDLEAAKDGLLETLGAVIDAYDVYTSGHSAQVAAYADAIAAQMRLSGEERARVVRAALVHDIGKVGIMDAVVSKPGKLTDEEYNTLKRHTTIGADIVGRMQGSLDLVPLVRHHHERWDGNGYPDGLSMEQIPRGARILALADSLDAMLSDRPYRRTRRFEEVLAEVERCAGTQFDPDVVWAFLAVVREKNRCFFRNSSAAVDRAVQGNDQLNWDKNINYFLKGGSLSAGKSQPMSALPEFWSQVS